MKPSIATSDHDLSRAPLSPSRWSRTLLTIAAVVATIGIYNCINYSYLRFAMNKLDAYPSNYSKSPETSALFSLCGGVDERDLVWGGRAPEIIGAQNPNKLLTQKQTEDREQQLAALERIGSGACFVDHFRMLVGLDANLRGIVDDPDLACSPLKSQDSPQEAPDEYEKASRLWRRLCGNVAQIISAHNDGDHFLLRHPAIRGPASILGANPLLEPDDCTRDLKGPFTWYAPKCMYERILGVRQGQEMTLYGVLPLASQVSVRGTVYDWNDARVNPRDDRHRQQLATLAEFDEAIEFAWTELERSLGMRRVLVRVMNGLPQFIIVTAGMVALFLLIQRLCVASWQKHSAARGRGKVLERFERDVAFISSSRDSSAQDIRCYVADTYQKFLTTGSATVADWLIEIIPLLGFLGTVYGMIDALGGIRAVVSADFGPDLERAMAQVGDSLSLAFTTTLLALVFTIFLILLRKITLTSEMNLVTNLPGLSARLAAIEQSHAAVPAGRRAGSPQEPRPNE